MSRVSTYLNFDRQTEEAFTFYKQVFGTEFEGDISRMGDVPDEPGQPPVRDEDKNLIMHVMLPILDGHMLMGTDISGSMGMKLLPGNNMYINLEPDSLEETRRIFDGLAVDGTIGVELQKMFWGDHFGSLTDKFGVQWMFNCGEK